MTERSDGSMPIWSLTSFPGFSARPYKKVLRDTQQLDCPWERGCVELGEVWGDLPFFVLGSPFVERNHPTRHIRHPRKAHPEERPSADAYPVL